MSRRICLRLGARDRNKNIAEVTRARFRVRFRGGEGKHVGGRIDSQIVPVQFMQVGVIRQDNGKFSTQRLCFMFEDRVRGALQQRFRKRDFRLDMDHFLFGTVLTSCVAGDSFGYEMRGWCVPRKILTNTSVMMLRSRSVNWVLSN